MRLRATKLSAIGFGGARAAMPSLDLQFATDKTLTARKGPTPVFTRASGATQVNAAGLIEYAPENLILSSNNIASPLWTKEGGTAATSVETVNGLTASVFNEDSASTTHRFFKVNDGLAGITSTYSVWLKPAGRRYVCVNLGSNGPSTFSKAVIDLVDRVVVNAGVGLTIAIQLEANGWARYSFTFVPKNDSGTMPIQSNFSSTVVSENGVGLDGAAFYVAGQQYERASTARAYMLTTTTAAYSPRFDHDPVTLACRGLLIEDQRTNLCLRSEELENIIWAKSSIIVTAPVVTANQANSPTGVLSADRVVFPDVNVAGAYSLVTQFFSQSAGVVCNASIYLRGLVGGERVWWTWTPNGATYVRKECVLTTSWQRFDFTYTSTAGNNFIQLGVDLRDALQSAQPAQTIFAWGAQLEVGAFPTSYIPTAAAALPRSADVCSITGSDFTSFKSTAGFTALCNFSLLATTTAGAMAPIAVNQSSANGVFLYKGITSSDLTVYHVSTNTSIGSITANFTNKAAMAYDGDSVVGVLSGGAVSVETGSTALSFTGMTIGSNRSSAHQMSGHIASIRYFKKRLPNAKLQSLTL